MSDLPTATRAWAAAFDRYRQWNKRLPGDIIRSRAARLSYRLWQAFKALAPTPARLEEELVVLGYAFKRRIDPRTGKAITPEKELRARIRSLNFLSVSFLYREWKNRREAPDGRFQARSRAAKRLGEAIVQTGPSTADPFAEFVSFLEGVVIQESRRRIASAAVRADLADMQVYIRRKETEARRLIPAETVATVPL